MFSEILTAANETIVIHESLSRMPDRMSWCTSLVHVRIRFARMLMRRLIRPTSSQTNNALNRCCAFSQSPSQTQFHCNTMNNERDHGARSRYDQMVYILSTRWRVSSLSHFPFSFLSFLFKRLSLRSFESRVRVLAFRLIRSFSHSRHVLFSFLVAPHSFYHAYYLPDILSVGIFLLPSMSPFPSTQLSNDIWARAWTFDPNKKRNIKHGKLSAAQ
jgi:hypothetical protein